MAWVFDHTGGREARCRRLGGKGLFAVAALLIVLALGWYFYGNHRFARAMSLLPSIADPNSIAVLRLPTSAQSRPGLFPDGMTESS